MKRAVALFWILFSFGSAQAKGRDIVMPVAGGIGISLLSALIYGVTRGGEPELLSEMRTELPWDSSEMNALDHYGGLLGQRALIRGIAPISFPYAQEIADRGGDLLLSEDLRRRSFRGGAGTGDFEFLSGYRFLRSEVVEFLDVDAATDPFLEGNEGIFLDDGNLGYVGFRFRDRITPYFSLRVTPILRLSSRDNVRTDHASLYVREAMASLTLRRLVVEGGKGGLRWGTGRSGHLLFSGENAPFTMGRLRSQVPVRPPGFLGLLGPAQFDAFFGQLDDRREFPGAKLSGLYFTFAPHERFEFGLGETILFGGEGAPTNNPLLFFSEKVTDDPNPANRNFLFHARYRIPLIEIEAYTELMWEDCCGSPPVNPRDMLNLTGLYFPRLDREGNLDLALEWVRTNHITYRHGTFTSGYVYKNRILGHPIGPDGTGLYLILRHFRTSAIQTRLTAAFEIRGKSGEDGGGVPYPPSRFEKAEQRYRWTAEGTYRVSRQTSLMPVIGVERVRNAAYRRGDDRWGFTAGIDFVYRL